MFDPVEFGVVVTIARSRGNITGFSVDAGGKRPAVLPEAVRTASRVGFHASG